jgi:transposase
MEQSYRQHDASFKREAVLLADESDKPDRQIEKELGIYQGAIRTWRKVLACDGKDAFPGTGHLKPMEEENLRLRRELAHVTEERDILKKAVAIFSEKR